MGSVIADCDEEIMARHSRQYSEYYKSVIASSRWRSVRGEALRQAGYRCQDCGTRGQLDGHHWRGYRMLGHETPSDVRMLCRPCHNRAHGRSRRRSGSLVLRAIAVVFLGDLLGHSLGWW